MTAIQNWRQVNIDELHQSDRHVKGNVGVITFNQIVKGVSPAGIIAVIGNTLNNSDPSRTAEELSFV